MDLLTEGVIKSVSIDDVLKKIQNQQEFQDGGKAGGIDFRALPITGQPQQASAMTPQVMLEMQELAVNSEMRDLIKEWDTIQRQIRGKQMPYTRLKEYIAVCYSKHDRAQIEKVTQLMQNLLKLEEECAVQSSPELKELFIAFEINN